MADLVITPTSVVKVAGLNVPGTAGETITAGQPVYLNAANLLMKAIATSAIGAAAVGIALHSASINQPLTYLSSGTITIGAAVVVGKAYYVSATSGGICPEADLITGNFPRFLGFATTAAIISIGVTAAGVAKS